MNLSPQVLKPEGVDFADFCNSAIAVGATLWGSLSMASMEGWQGAPLAVETVLPHKVYLQCERPDRSRYMTRLVQRGVRLPYHTDTPQYL